MPADFPFVICHDCDLLQHEVHLHPGCAACCPRCGAVLYRRATDSVNRTLAFALAAAVLFLIANIFPVLQIDVRGGRSAITVLGAVLSLWSQQRPLIAVAVLLTAVVIPAVELALVIYLLAPFRFGRAPAGAFSVLGLLHSLTPWSMVEVLMLGVLVSIAKLRDTFTIVPGVALWSLGGVTVLLAAMTQSFNVRDVWALLTDKRCPEDAP